MAGDPAAVCRAEEGILRLEVEDVLGGGCGVDHVAAGRVDHAFRLARRAARVQHEERVLSSHPLDGARWVGCRESLMPPHIATLLELELELVGPEPLEDEHLGDGHR